MAISLAAVDNFQVWIDAVQTAAIVVSTLILAYVANLLRIAAKTLGRDMRSIVDRQVSVESRVDKLEAEAHSRTARSQDHS